MGRMILVYLTKSFSPMSFDILSKLGGLCEVIHTDKEYIFRKQKNQPFTDGFLYLQFEQIRYWWRWRELNPRPIIFPYRFLQVQFVIFFIPSILCKQTRLEFWQPLNTYYSQGKNNFVSYFSRRLIRTSRLYGKTTLHLGSVC